LAVCASIVALVVGSQASSTALADPPAGASAPASAPRSRGFVELSLSASDEEATILTQAVRELVGRMGLGLRTVRTDAPQWGPANAPTDAGDERARVWIDARAGDHVGIAVSVVEQGWFSRPVRRIVPRAESSAIVVEQVAHVVHASLESLLEGESHEVQTNEVEVAPLVNTAPARPQESRSPETRTPNVGVDLAAFASGRGVASSSGALLGGGAAVDVMVRRGRWWPNLWLAASYSAPFDAANQDITLETSLQSYHVVPSLRLFDLGVLQVDFGVGAGLDLFQTTPRNPGASVGAKGDKTLADPVLVGQLVARVRIGAAVRLLLGLDLDYDLHRRQYETVDGTASVPVMEPWPARPSVIAGLCMPLVGASGCAGTQ
jgi:hypothetical protein